MRKKSVEDDGWDGFLKLCSTIRSPEKLRDFFELFLTIEERETVASRYLIVKALLEQLVTQRELASKFNVSIAQITRGSNALKIIDPALKRFLEKELGITV